MMRQPQITPAKRWLNSTIDHISRGELIMVAREAKEARGRRMSRLSALVLLALFVLAFSSKGQRIVASSSTRSSVWLSGDEIELWAKGKTNQQDGPSSKVNHKVRLQAAESEHLSAQASSWQPSVIALKDNQADSRDEIGAGESMLIGRNNDAGDYEAISGDKYLASPLNFARFLRSTTTSFNGNDAILDRIDANEDTNSMGTNKKTLPLTNAQVQFDEDQLAANRTLKAAKRKMKVEQSAADNVEHLIRAQLEQNLIDNSTKWNSPNSSQRLSFKRSNSIPSPIKIQAQSDQLATNNDEFTDSAPGDGGEEISFAGKQFPSAHSYPIPTDSEMMPNIGAANYSSPSVSFGKFKPLEEKALRREVKIMQLSNSTNHRRSINNYKPTLSETNPNYGRKLALNEQMSNSHLIGVNNNTFGNQMNGDYYEFDAKSTGGGKLQSVALKPMQLVAFNSIDTANNNPKTLAINSKLYRQSSSPLREKGLPRKLDNRMRFPDEIPRQQLMVMEAIKKIPQQVAFPAKHLFPSNSPIYFGNPKQLAANFQPQPLSLPLPVQLQMPSTLIGPANVYHHRAERRKPIPLGKSMKLLNNLFGANWLAVNHQQTNLPPPPIRQVNHSARSSLQANLRPPQAPAFAINERAPNSLPISSPSIGANLNLFDLNYLAGKIGDASSRLYLSSADSIRRAIDSGELSPQFAFSKTANRRELSNSNEAIMGNAQETYGQSAASSSSSFGQDNLEPPRASEQVEAGNQVETPLIVNHEQDYETRNQQPGELSFGSPQQPAGQVSSSSGGPNSYFVANLGESAGQQQHSTGGHEVSQVFDISQGQQFLPVRQQSMDPIALNQLMNEQLLANAQYFAELSANERNVRNRQQQQQPFYPTFLAQSSELIGQRPFKSASNLDSADENSDSNEAESGDSSSNEDTDEQVSPRRSKNSASKRKRPGGFLASASHLLLSALPLLLAPRLGLMFGSMSPISRFQALNPLTFSSHRAKGNSHQSNSAPPFGWPSNGGNYLANGGASTPGRVSNNQPQVFTPSPVGEQPAVLFASSSTTTTTERPTVRKPTQVSSQSRSTNSSIKSTSLGALTSTSTQLPANNLDGDSKRNQAQVTNCNSTTESPRKLAQTTLNPPYSEAGHSFQLASGPNRRLENTQSPLIITIDEADLDEPEEDLRTSGYEISLEQSGDPANDNGRLPGTWPTTKQDLIPGRQSNGVVTLVSGANHELVGEDQDLDDVTIVQLKQNNHRPVKKETNNSDSNNNNNNNNNKRNYSPPGKPNELRTIVVKNSSDLFASGQSVRKRISLLTNSGEKSLFDASHRYLSRPGVGNINNNNLSLSDEKISRKYSSRLERRTKRSASYSNYTQFRDYLNNDQSNVRNQHKTAPPPWRSQSGFSVPVRTKHLYEGTNSRSTQGQNNNYRLDLAQFNGLNRSNWEPSRGRLDEYTFLPDNYHPRPLDLPTPSQVSTPVRPNDQQVNYGRKFVKNYDSSGGNSQNRFQSSTSNNHSYSFERPVEQVSLYQSGANNQYLYTRNSSGGNFQPVEDDWSDSKTVSEYLKSVQFNDSDRDKLMASYLTCDGLLNNNDHCLERLACEFSDPENIERADKLDRAVSSILLGHILINNYIQNSFKLRLKSASLFGYTKSGKCSRFSCNKLAKLALKDKSY